MDYVVVHELVHLIHRDHTKHYLAKLGKVTPDYELRRERLRLIDGQLAW
jgi:predicted metal-dependent hydrolase